MNILFYFDHQINPYKGGTERVSDILAHALKQRGYTVFYCARYNEAIANDIVTLFLPTPQELLSNDNITFLENQVHEKQIDFIINQASNGEDIYLFNHHTLNVKARIISVLHFSIWEGLNYFNELQQTKFRFTQPKEWFPNFIRWAKQPYNKQKAIRGKSKRFSFIHEHSDAVVLLSKSYVTDFTQVAHLQHTEKLHVIPNPLTYLQTANAHKENILLFVGRLSFQEKRVDRLMEIWRLLHRKYPDWKLIIVGDGADRKRLEMLSHQMKLERVSFTGTQNPKSFYESAKIFCMTSTHEGLPMVLLEAMQNHVVPIAFDSFGAAADIISDKKNGYLIPPFDICEYTTRLEELMKNQVQWEQMAHQTAIGIEKYNITNICNCWLHLFQELK